MMSGYSMAIVPVLMLAVSVAWSAAVIVLLIKIWNKVKHLPE